MNIFILDDHIPNIRKMMSDQHVVKMILEYCQILCTVHHVQGVTEDTPYRKTHQNHPCVKWVLESIDNYHYLEALCESLCSEYTYRFNKRHKCQDVLEWASVNHPGLRSNGFTPHVQCMPDIYKQEDAVAAYRKYYVYKYVIGMHNNRKRMRFTKRDIPNFILEAI